MPPALRRGFSTIFFSAKPTLIPFALRSEPALNAVEGVNSVEGSAPRVLRRELGRRAAKPSKWGKFSLKSADSAREKSKK
jgi:hypothetical protein